MALFVGRSALIVVEFAIIAAVVSHDFKTPSSSRAVAAAVITRAAQCPVCMLTVM